MLDIKKYENGLILLKEKNNSQKVMFSITIGAGFENDDNHHHLAHLTEHLVAFPFLNNPKLNPTEINAQTTDTNTTYWFKSKKADCYDLINEYFDGVFKFKIQDKVLNNEKKVIDIEKGLRGCSNEYEDEKNVNNATAKAGNNATSKAGNKPLNFYYEFAEVKIRKEEKKEVVETRNIKNEDVLKFYNKYYQPSNSVVYVSCNDQTILDYVESEIEKKLSNNFVQIEKKEKEKNISFYRPLKNYFIRPSVKTDQNGLVGVKILMPSVSPKHNLFYAAFLYSFYFQDFKGFNAKAYQELRVKRGLIYSLQANIEISKNLEYFSILYKTYGKNISQANRLLRKIIDDLGKNGIDKEEFKQLKKAFLEDYENYIQNDNEYHISELIHDLLDSNSLPEKNLKKIVNNIQDCKFIKDLRVEDFNNYAKIMSNIKNFFIYAEGKKVSKQDLMSFKSLRNHDYKNDYYYEKVLCGNEKYKYIKNLQRLKYSGGKISKYEKELINKKKINEMLVYNEMLEELKSNGIIVESDMDKNKTQGQSLE